MSKVLFSPTGRKIIGTLERVRAIALIEDGVGRTPDGTFEFEFVGQTDIDWDSQETVLSPEGERLFVDGEGGQWPESKLVLRDA